MTATLCLCDADCHSQGLFIAGSNYPCESHFIEKEKIKMHRIISNSPNYPHTFDSENFVAIRQL